MDSDLRRELDELKERIRRLEEVMRMKEGEKAPPPTVLPIPEPPQIPAPPPVAPPAKPAERPAERYMERLKEQREAEARAPAVQPEPSPPRRPPQEPVAVPKAPKEKLPLELAFVQTWLSRAGILALVVGAALFLNLVIPKLGPWGKIGLALAGSAALIILGAQLQRRYQLYGRLLIGGGCGLLYFTVYAMYFIPSTRVLDNQVVDLSLLAVVAAGIIAYSVGLKSQVVASTAFSLGYLTVNLGQVRVFSLVALVFLTAALAIVVWRYQWNFLLLGGLLATYTTHIRWTHGGLPGPIAVDDLVTHLVLITIYFVLYTFAAITARREDEGQRLWLVATLTSLNALFWILLAGSALERYRHGVWGVTLFVAAAVHFGLAWFSWAVRPGARYYLVWAVIGVILIYCAVPAQFSGTAVAVGWAVESGVLVLVGNLIHVPVFSTFGFLGFLLSFGDFLALALTGEVSRKGPWPWLDGFFVAAAAYASRRLQFRQAQTSQTVATLSDATAVGIGLILLVSLANAVSSRWLATSYAFAGLVIVGSTVLARDKTLRFTGLAISFIASFFAVVRLTGQRLDSGTLPVPDVLIALLGVVALYATRLVLFVRPAGPAPDRAEASIPSVLAGILLTFVLGYGTVPPWNVATVTASTALLVWAGNLTSDKPLRQAGTVLSLGAFLVAFGYLIHSWVQRGPASMPLFFSGLVAVAALYVIRIVLVTSSSKEELDPLELAMPSVMAGILLTVFLGYGVPVPWNITAAAMGTAFLVWTGRAVRDRPLQETGRVLSFGAFLVAVGYLARQWLGGQPASPAVVWSAAAAAAALYGIRAPLVASAEEGGRDVGEASAPSVMAGMLATFLVGYAVALPWNIPAVAAFALALVCFGWITRDVWLSYLGGVVAITAFGFAVGCILTGQFGVGPAWTTKWLPVGAVTVALYANASLWRRYPLVNKESRAVGFASLSLATVLLVFIALTERLAGSWHSLAWGVAGCGFVAFSFGVKDSMLRRSGVLLLTLAVGKLFAWDLQALGGYTRILSFLALGAILLAISYTYFRYKDHILKYL